MSIRNNVRFGSKINNRGEIKSRIINNGEKIMFDRYHSGQRLTLTKNVTFQHSSCFFI